MLINDIEIVEINVLGILKINILVIFVDINFGILVFNGEGIIEDTFFGIVVINVVRIFVDIIIELLLIGFVWLVVSKVDVGKKLLYLHQILHDKM